MRAGVALIGAFLLVSVTLTHQVSLSHKINTRQTAKPVRGGVSEKNTFAKSFWVTLGQV